MSKLVIRHDLHLMSKEELAQYLRDVSTFVGLDPDLNAFDAIWMPNESGQGQSLVVYARRGTAEILRNKLGVDVDELTDHVVNGSIVYTAKGRNKDGRKEQAIGSKSIQGLTGKVLDDAIMTASTRALRRLTMQFTTLGILDESEVSAAKNEAPPANAAAGATLTANPMPLIFAQPTVQPNNGPGKPVEVTTVPALPAAPAVLEEQFLGQQDQIDAAMKQVADKQADAKKTRAPATPVESTTSTETNPATEVDIAPARPKRTRKPKNTVVLDVEPETVSSKPAVSTVVETRPTQAVAVVPPQANPAPPISVPAVGPDPVQATTPVELPVTPAGMPTKEQMDGYRAKVGVFTAQLPASQDLGSVQKMRAFITHMTGAAPQNMTVEQWEKQIAWFESFAVTNGAKGLIKYINDTLGVK